MQNRKRALLLAASCTALLAGSIVMIACGSDDSSGAPDSNDGGTTSDVITNEGDAKPKDASPGGDACASEAYGESCEASTDCACSGVCAARKCVTPPACGDAILSWNGPTSNVDGTCITDLAGFTLNWWLDDGGTPADNALDAGSPCVAGASFACGDAGGTAVQLDCAYRLTGLGNGTWDFTASAYTDGGVTSSPSVQAQKSITCHDGG